MNKALRATLVAAIALSSVAYAAKDKKTELVMRDNRHSALAFTTLHELNIKSNPDGFKTKVAGDIFYNESQSKSSLGKTFAANNRNYVTIGKVLTYPAETAVANPTDVNNNYLLHYPADPTNNALASTVFFNPKETSFGGRVDISVGLDKWVKGLYFKANWVVLNVKHDLGVTYTGIHAGATGTDETIQVSDLLSGNAIIRNTTGTPNISNEQLALTHAKIAGSHSETGLANVEQCLGWRFLDEKDYYVSANVAWRVPTGYSPDGEFMWQPRLGSKHWALGAGLDGGVTLWEDEDQTLKLKGEVNYKYLFQETEKRTFSLKNTTTWAPETKHILSQYYLLGELGKFSLLPAANVLTRDADVTPGSQVDAFALLNYNNGGLTFDLGYNLFWKETESVKMKGTWDNHRYGFPKAACALTATNPFTPTNTTESYKEITGSDIDTGVAETPSILSHTVFAGLGYIFNEWENPLMLGLGGSYEFGNDHVAADSYTIYGKIGFAF